MNDVNRRQMLQLGLGAATLTLVASKSRAAGHATHRVEIRQSKFRPEVLEMQAGDKVTFVNLDGAPHTASADDGSFETGRLAKSEEATVVVKAAGTHAYFCRVHPRMRGQIIAS